MKGDIRQKDLLGFIAEQLHCDYISDLHFRINHKRLQFHLPLPHEFSECEWNDAVQYIIGNKTGRLSDKQAYLLLMNFSKAI